MAAITGNLALAEVERRRASRRKVFKRVQVMSLDRKSASTIDCTLRNVSSSGAQLIGPGSAISRIPNQFYLVVPGQLRTVRCKVVWKTYDAVGVKFLSDPGHLASEPPIDKDRVQDPAGCKTLPEASSRLEHLAEAYEQDSDGNTPPTSSDVDGDASRHHASEHSRAAANHVEPDARGAPAAASISELQALVSDFTSELLANERQFCHLPIQRLNPRSDKLRGTCKEEDLQDLVRSIRARGLLQPVIVRRRCDGDDFEIVAGERRWRAAQLAEIREVPVLMCTLSDAEALAIALIENVQRLDLSPLEEAQGYAQLMERHGYTQEKLAGAVGKSRSHVANMVRLLTLPDEVKSHLEGGRLTAGHARTLISADDPVELANQIIAHGLSVRESERLASSQHGSKGCTRKEGGETVNALLDLERQVSKALGLKVDIIDAGRSGGRIVVHVQTMEQLKDVCRRLTLQS
jgi:ParB family transcriptional regulator, chromosome partitioning protein